MTMRQLHVFKTVCEEGSFTRAAARLYMTQPAVSRAVGELEEETGLKLFERLGKKIYVSQAGELFLQKTARLLELYRELKEGTAGLARQAVLRVGSSITIANFWLPSIIKEFEQLSPGTCVRVWVDSASATAERLWKNEVDLALVEGTFSRERFWSAGFSSYGVFPFCSPAYPLQSGALTAGELAGEKLLLREKGSAIRDALDSAFTLMGLSAQPLWESVNSQALVRAAAGGLGVAVLPELLVKRELQEGILKRIEVKDMELQNENHILCRRDKDLTEQMQLFIRCARSR